MSVAQNSAGKTPCTEFSKFMHQRGIRTWQRTYPETLSVPIKHKGQMVRSWLLCPETQTIATATVRRGRKSNVAMYSIDVCTVWHFRKTLSPLRLLAVHALHSVPPPAHHPRIRKLRQPLWEMNAFVNMVQRLLDCRACSRASSWRSLARCRASICSVITFLSSTRFNFLLCSSASLRVSSFNRSNFKD